MMLLSILVGVSAILLIIFLRSNKSINLVSLLHALYYAGLSIYQMYAGSLPQYYLENKYFFIDSLGIYELLIASVIFFLSILYLEGYIKSLVEHEELNPKFVKLFYICMNLLLMSVAFSFFSNNLALFWIFLELTTIFSAILIVILNAVENIYAALKYLFIASTCMLFSFVGLILLYAFTKHNFGAGTLNWSELMSSASLITPRIAAYSFMFIFIGFGAKAAIAPFHTWVPHAHSKAPSAVSAILSAVILNVGIYGIIRTFAVVRQTSSGQIASNMLIIFGFFTLGIASLSMLQQKNVKKLIAFSSIEHMGTILIAIGLATKASVFWVLIYIMASALAKSLLFLCAGIANRQYMSNDIDSVRNFIKLQPLASVGIIVGVLAISGLPPFALFMPKLLVLIQISKFSVLMLIIALLSILISTGSFALFFTKFFSSVDEASSIHKYNTPAKMKASIIILIILLALLGIFLPDRLADIAGNIVAELKI
ncbi:hydrogenase membrane subunit [Candidatus Woesearchaeota archaeon]|nr:hydrogenase membrane subunit [Candidatus Woesearchaeota archaeon]MBI2130495.1 hydrogenase membrane subunit [Candidatus Woesearchaeota archaeon]MBI2661583.1 hydrogenase membrane subunit [Candidatus Woesearchaeota archaeon]